MATGRTWPVGLPQITNLPGARQQPPDGIARSTISGAPQQRRRTHADSPREFTEQILVSAAQLVIFETFFRDTLGNGALSFDHVDSWDNTPARLRFTGGPPTFRPAGASDLAWTIDLKLLEIAS